MRRQGPVTLRYIVVAALVVLVINLQLTWWIVFVLGLNRDHLELQRRWLLATAGVEGAALRSELVTARTALEAAVLMGDEPGLAAAPEPYAGWRSRPLAETCPPVALNSSGGIELSVQRGRSCITGVFDSDWQAQLLDIGGDFQIVSTAASDRPSAALEAPFEALAVQPRDEVWDGLLDHYRRRIVMMVTEGAFFAVLLLVLLGLLWRTFRREVELERQHRNFLSAVTHELKSPLASIRLALETVATGRASGDSARKFLGNAVEDAERLENLVRKVLEATRYSDRRSVLARKDSNFSRVVDETVAAARRRTEAVGGRLAATVEPDIYGDIDEEAMAIAISNLLENAVSHGGRPPHVDVRFGLHGNHAVLEVEDNGPGVDEKDRKAIFGRFFRSGDEMTRSSQGTGLGLYLVQQIVEAHRGSVKVAETGPDGSIFRVAVPAYER